jgi:hypothetical protein
MITAAALTLLSGCAGWGIGSSSSGGGVNLTYALWDPHEQIGYLQSGRARFKIGDDERLLEALDGYSIPGEVPHGVVALEDCVFVDVFSPPREEYRQ